MEKLKKIAKYVTNTLLIINALILVLDPIWGIPYANQISETIIGVVGVLGTYLLGTKTIKKIAKTESKG